MNEYNVIVPFLFFVLIEFLPFYFISLFVYWS